MIEITPQELQLRLSNTDRTPFLLDVREPAEFEICHITDSVLIPMSKVSESVEDLPRQQPIVVICHHGMRSYMVGAFLEQQGFEDIFNLEGGINAWAQAIDSNMPTY